jgi:hypothetical protein
MAVDESSFSVPRVREPWDTLIDFNKFLQRNASHDGAILELDRPVEKPFKAAISLCPRPPVLGQDVFLLGSPSGLPLKYVRGGKVLQAVRLPAMSSTLMQHHNVHGHPGIPIRLGAE